MDYGMPPPSGEDWLSRNSRRSYPLAEWASPLLASGDPLPTSILADAMLVVAMEPQPVHVSCVSVLPSSVTVEFSCGGISIGAASAAFGDESGGERAEIVSSSGLCSGWVSFGSVLSSDTGFLSSIRGVHVQESCPLESRCLVFSGPAAVTSMAGWDGENLPRRGDVLVRTSPLMSVSAESADEGDLFQMEIGLVDPTSMLPDCLPLSDDPACSCADAVRTISGVPGDVSGNVRIVVISPPGAPQGSVWTHPDRNSVSVLATIPRKFMCERTPVVPDSFGRLGADFSNDCPPARNYGLDYSGPDCDNPPPVIPDPDLP